MWRYILIHHSLTKDSKTVSWQAIRKFHINERGWRDIGYHFGIELVNDEYEILCGRPLDMPGAHCRESGMNRKAIGICCVGNYDEEEPKEEMLKRLASLCRWLMRTYDIPKERVLGHRDFAEYKSCPGKMFDLDRLRKSL